MKHLAFRYIVDISTLRRITKELDVDDDLAFQSSSFSVTAPSRKNIFYL